MADEVVDQGEAGADDAMLDNELMEWLRRVSLGADWVTSICTGSLVLGDTGLLQGKNYDQIVGCVAKPGTNSSNSLGA